MSKKKSTRAKSNEIVVSEIEYLVETIVQKGVYDGCLKYEVKWEGYPKSQNTLEPFENLGSCPEKIKEFENRFRKRNETIDFSDFEVEFEEKLIKDLWENGTLKDIVAADTESKQMMLLWDTGDITLEDYLKVEKKYPILFVEFFKETLCQLAKVD